LTEAKQIKKIKNARKILKKVTRNNDLKQLIHNKSEEEKINNYFQELNSRLFWLINLEKPNRMIEEIIQESDKLFDSVMHEISYYSKRGFLNFIKNNKAVIQRIRKDPTHEIILKEEVSNWYSKMNFQYSIQFEKNNIVITGDYIPLEKFVVKKPRRLLVQELNKKVHPGINLDISTTIVEKEITYYQTEIDSRIF